MLKTSLSYTLKAAQAGVKPIQPNKFQNEKQY